MNVMRFDIITIFPEAFASYLNASVLGRAQKKKLIDIRFTNPRDFVKDKHRTVDDKPYGGGAGMVMKAEPILKSVASIKKTKRSHIVVLSAKGKQFNQKTAMSWSKKYDQIILVSGRYEGIDERVVTALKAEEISIGPFVTTDGDIAAMAIISAISRLLPGVITKESLAEESGHEPEYPHYTRPEILAWKGKKLPVPKILLSGNHAEISKWRRGKRRKI